MPKAKDPDEGREERERREERARRERGEQGHHEHGRRGGDDDRRDEKERPRRRRMGREHAVHQELLEKRLGGGDPPTPEAYATALKEWQQLPGSIVRPPTDVKPSESEKDTAQVRDQNKKE
jgi:hypothetical protein